MIALAAIALLLAAPQVAERSASRVVTLTATGGHDEGAVHVIEAVADLDSDNDGIGDLYDLRVSCSGTHIASAILSARDSVSGLPTGKRMHKPMTVTARVHGTSNVDVWSTAMTGHPVFHWDLATGKGARSAMPTVPASSIDPVVCAAA